MPLSASTMSRLLGRMTAAMGKPFSDAKVEAQATEYARAMGPIPDYAVEWAVDRLIRESDRYPKASTLRKLAQTCPMLANGNHDDSLRARMVRWEADPWATVASLKDDKQGCRSSPCPVCGSVVLFSDRGAVVVHDDRRHSEAQVAYSNCGKTEWFTMAAPVLPESKRQISTKIMNPYRTLKEPTRIGQAIEPGDAREPEPAEATA